MTDLRRVSTIKVGSDAYSRAKFKKTSADKKQKETYDEESKMIADQKLDEIIETKDRVNQAKKMNEVMTDIMSAFQRMTAIVSMQENKIERIYQETRTAETNIKKGRKEVEQIYDSVAGKRSLIIKVFATILVFSIIYILFLM